MLGTSEERIERYLQVVSQLKEDRGDWRRGEIEILKGSRDELVVFENRLKERQRACGAPETDVELGVLIEEKRIFFVRDPVLFAPKKDGGEPVLGTYIRVIYKNAIRGNLGVFILAVDEPSGRIILTRMFRHAVRGWTVEGNGTIAEDGEALEATVARCVREELGSELLRTVKIGDQFVSERGLVAGRVPVYVAFVDFSRKGDTNDITVRGHVLLTANELNDTFLAEKLMLNGVFHLCADGYTHYAFHQARAKGIVK